MTRNITTLLMLLLSHGCYGERKAWSAERGGWREKSGGMQESGHALAGQKRHFCCWQRAGTIGVGRKVQGCLLPGIYVFAGKKFMKIAVDSVFFFIFAADFSNHRKQT